MSQIIKCDKCQKLMHADSRSEKRAYCKIGIDYTDGFHRMHLCKGCHRQFMTEFMKIFTPEEYDGAFGEGRARSASRIKALEPANVARVIHCRNCKYFSIHRCMDSMPIEICDLDQTFYDPDRDFCSLAESKEE